MPWLALFADTPAGSPDGVGGYSGWAAGAVSLGLAVLYLYDRFRSSKRDHDSKDRAISQAADAAVADAVAKMKAATDAAEEAKSKTRRAEDRKEDERQGKFWKAALDKTIERHGKEIADLRDRHDREMEDLRHQIAELRVENEECRDNAARQDVKIAVGEERQKILLARIEQQDILLRSKGIDPAGSGLHDVLRDDYLPRSPGDGGAR